MDWQLIAGVDERYYDYLISLTDEELATERFKNDLATDPTNSTTLQQRRIAYKKLRSDKIALNIYLSCLSHKVYDTLLTQWCE